mmetsp:Transcript_57044/g.167021  ORF Transcript_57044/g.167021 Transcript_57044/m.167021 type:complete len:396 (-) Transcript_57044:117-1304(-)
MSRQAAAKALAEQIEAGIKEATENKTDLVAAKRALFGTYAEQWNDAEEADDKEALKVLEELRPKLKYRPPKQALISRLFMFVRLVLTVLVASWGCMCILLLTPVRWTHPLFKLLGVPNGWLPMDLCLTAWARAVLAAAGVKVTVEGEQPQEAWGRGTCGIIVYNHASNLDPFIVSSSCHSQAPKYVGKKTLFKFPFFGWMSLAVGMIPINRGDREKAIRVMNETVTSIMRRFGRSIAVSPEGTRTTDGHLRLPFKKGTFHTQEQTGAALLPLAIHGAFELWPPGQLFTNTGEVTVRVLPRQPLAGETATREASRLALQRSYAKILAKHALLGARPLSPRGMAECLLTVLASAVVLHQFWRAYSALTAAAGLSVSGIIGLLAVATIIIAVVVDQLF